MCLCTGQSYNGQCKTQNVDCRLWTRGKMQTESKKRVGVKFRMRTADGVKCRPSINCSRQRVKGKKIRQIHENDQLLDICFHKSIPLFSGTFLTTRKHNCTLEPFFCPRDLTLQL